MSSSSLHQSRHRTARGSSRSTKNRLGAYLAAGLGATTGLTASVDAAIIDINIGPSGFNIGGVNGGLYEGSASFIPDFPFAGQGYIGTLNNFVNPLAGTSYIGIAGSSGYAPPPGLMFAAGAIYASPVNFAKNALIDGNAGGGAFTSYPAVSAFRFGSDGFVTSPDFGPNSYMGFKTDSGNFGWLEVTWSSATSEFQILSGAYESVPGVAIPAGVQAVPEPSTLALGGVGALVCGGAALRRWRKQKRA